MRALVTGGAGFIGSTLVDRLLAEGHRVEVVDDLSTGSLANLAGAREQARVGGEGQLKIHQLDVGDERLVDLVAHRDPDVVFHLAGASAKAGRAAHEQARRVVLGTIRVLDAAVAAGEVKVVAVAGARSQVDPVRGIADRAAHEYHEAYRRQFGVGYTTIVLPTVYGPRQTAATESSVVATFVHRVAGRQTCVLHGGGTQTRDLLFVDDAVDALVRACDRGVDGEVIEVGSGIQTSIADVHARVVAVAAGRGRADGGDTVTGDRRVGEPGAVPVDPSTAHDRLGWRAWTALDDGIAATLDALDP